LLGAPLIDESRAVGRSNHTRVRRRKVGWPRKSRQKRGTERGLWCGERYRFRLRPMHSRGQHRGCFFYRFRAHSTCGWAAAGRDTSGDGVAVWLVHWLGHTALGL